MSDDAERETPEQREKRYLEKAKALGPQAWHVEDPEHPYPKPDATPEADIELDEDGKVVRDNTRGPLTIYNAGDRMAQYPSTFVRERTPEEKAAVQAALTVARNKVQMVAEPIAFKMEQHVPGAAYVRRALNKLSDGPPAPREPVQMQREFSNDQEKEAYLERLRQAMKNAASKK